MSTPSDKTLRLERTKLTPQSPRGGRNIPLIVAVVAGTAAAVLVGIVLNNQPRTIVQPAPVAVAPTTTPVVEAIHDIPAQTVITADMVKPAQVKPSELVPNAIASTADAVNRVALTALKAGDQIKVDDIGPNNQNFSGLASMVEKGDRAMTIALDSNSSVAGFLKPGDHVDVIGTFTVQNRTITRTVLQNVTLLATGAQVMQMAPGDNNNNNNSLIGGSSDQQEAQAQPAKPQEIPNATVLVTPLDAEKLILAASKGKLMLTLRSNTDPNQAVIPMIDESAVTTIKTVSATPPPPPPPPVEHLPTIQPAPVMAPPPPPPTVTVIRGSTVQEDRVGA